MDTSNTHLLSRRAMMLSLAGGLVTRRTLLAVQSKPYFPRGKDWETRTPKDAAMDAAALDDAVKYAAEHNSTGLVIVRGGRIVTEQYWQQWTPATAQPNANSRRCNCKIPVGIVAPRRRAKPIARGIAVACAICRNSAC